MAYHPKAILKIGKYKFRAYNSITICSAWKTLGDTATMKLPNLRQMLEANLSTGDEVEIFGGYEVEGEELPLLFSGYIKEIQPKTPFQIECEDELFNLKRQKVESKAWQNTNLKTVLDYALAGTKVVYGDIPEVAFSTFRIDKKNNTVAKVLRKIKEAYGLAVYFREGQLYVGLPYTEDLSKLDGGKANFHFQKNMVGSGELTYKKADDVKIKAKVINFLKDNSKVEFQVGDDDGEQRTLFLRTETTDKNQLQKIAETELQKYKYEGYRGTFTAFGIPRMIHSGTVGLMDDEHPEREGKYICESVETRFKSGSSASIRQVIELGKKL